MRIVLVGGGGHASDVLGVFEEIARISDPNAGSEITPIIGIVADDEVDPGRFEHRNVRQIGDLSDLKSIDATHYILGIGFSQGRKALHERVAPVGLEAASVIHPRADIPPSVPVGAGTVIMSGARISPMVTIGEHVCLSYGCMIGHDCDVQDFATVLPGAAVSGEITLGNASVIGTNASIRQGLTIGNDAMVGMGAVVLDDVADGTTVVGNPAREPKRG